MKNIKHKHYRLDPEKIFLYSGIMVLFFTWMYLTLNTEEVEAKVHSWISLLLGSIALLFTARFIK